MEEGRLNSKPILLLACVLACGGAFAEEFAGEWTLTLDTPRGVRHPTLAISKDGNEYSGVYTGRMGPLNIEAIETDGNAFSFPLQITIPIGTIDVHYSGTVEGNAMTGVVSNPRGEVPFTGTREGR